jgi:hypothetical protein
MGLQFSTFRPARQFPFQLFRGTLKAIRRFCNLCERFSFITYSDYRPATDGLYAVSRQPPCSRSGDWLVLPRSLLRSAFPLASSLCSWISNSVDLSLFGVRISQKTAPFLFLREPQENVGLEPSGCTRVAGTSFRERASVLVGAMLSDS